MLLNQLLDYLNCKPFAGFITSITGWFLGSVQLSPTVSITFYQETILWYLQIISLIIGCVAGIFTIISLIRRTKKKCK
jgi:hypothetical protein